MAIRSAPSSYKSLRCRSGTTFPPPLITTACHAMSSPASTSLSSELVASLNASGIALTPELVRQLTKQMDEARVKNAAESKRIAAEAKAARQTASDTATTEPGRVGVTVAGKCVVPFVPETDEPIRSPEETMPSVGRQEEGTRKGTPAMGKKHLRMETTIAGTSAPQPRIASAPPQPIQPQVSVTPGPSSEAPESKTIRGVVYFLIIPR